ncbi:MAG: hypothetical protein Q8K75_09080 [Chlamydiales bacterium]|nr:hypothetical protein [Chlamydiales bacterium]
MPKKAESDSEPKRTEDKAAEIGTQAKDAVEKVFKLATNVRRDTMAYIIMAVGLVILPWLPLWGGAIVGIVFGVYFSEEMLKRIKSFRQYLEKEGQAKTIVLGGAILALLLVIPTLVLGAIAAVGIVALINRAT